MNETKHSPAKIGFLQAAGITLYVSLFAFSVQGIQSWAETGNMDIGQIAQIIIMLSAFIVSATICGSLMFAYPITLFMKGEKGPAYRIVAWAVGWLVVFLMLFGTIAISLS